ncbi:MAG: hypothetical protein KAS66_14985, partial [Candidatus Omnitrophica bacterium]|nr:hypothetical protein [Candidatus Omnitrophota bacterium]
KETVEIKTDTDTDEGIYIDLEYTNNDETDSRSNQLIRLNERIIKKIIKVYNLSKNEERERKSEAHNVRKT